MSSKEVRVRFAPSPTGYLHVGGARTALFNWLYARKTGGKFILRIEDTDEARSTEESLRIQIDELKWLGLDWDEGPDIGGPFPPYRQKDRKEIYLEHAEKLIEMGKAYYCFSPDSVFEELREKAKKEGRPPHYDESMLDTSPLKEAKERLAKGEKGAILFRSPREAIAIEDAVRGRVEFGPEMVGDFVILRSSGLPVYNFCCVIDDHLMEITHILRGDDHLSNTVRQEMVYQAFGWQSPIYGHISMILGEDRHKLSKRHGSTSVGQFRERGFLSESLVNFLALLGWNPGDERELMSREELTQSFSLERLNPSPAIFDETKLRWMNGMYIRQLPLKEILLRSELFLEEAGYDIESRSEEWLLKLIEAVRTGLETLSDIGPACEVFFDEAFQLTDEAKEVLKWEGSPSVVHALREVLESFGEITAENLKDFQNQVKDKSGQKGKHLFMPIRVATTGKPHGPELAVSLPLIGVDSLKKRVEKVLKTLES